MICQILSVRRVGINILKKAVDVGRKKHTEFYLLVSVRERNDMLDTY